MSGRNLAIIVVALRPRSGVTLLARAFADYFILSHENPLIFDTDDVERRLSRHFPQRANVVDLDRIRGQMTLFDTLAAPVAEKRVVDVTHRALNRFFGLMAEIDYLAEARLQGIEPAIFYIADRDRESFELGLDLRDRFDCPFVLVENAYLGEPNTQARRTQAYAALVGHPLRMRMPPLDSLVADVISRTDLSFGAFMRDEVRNLSLAYLSRPTIRAWIMQVFREIHRTIQALSAMPLAPRAAVATRAG